MHRLSTLHRGNTQPKDGENSSRKDGIVRQVYAVRRPGDNGKRNMISPARVGVESHDDSNDGVPDGEGNNGKLPVQGDGCNAGADFEHGDGPSVGRPKADEGEPAPSAVGRRRGVKVSVGLLGVGCKRRRLLSDVEGEAAAFVPRLLWDGAADVVCIDVHWRVSSVG